MENLPQEQRKQRLIQSKPSEKGEIITYLSRMGDVLDDVPKRSEIIVLPLTVYAIIDGDKTNIFVGKHDLGVHSDFQIVSSKPGHILDDHAINIPCINIGQHFLEARTIEVCAAVTIIYIELVVGNASVLCVLLQNLLLRRDLSRVFFPYCKDK